MCKWEREGGELLENAMLPFCDYFCARSKLNGTSDRHRRRDEVKDETLFKYK